MGFEKSKKSKKVLPNSNKIVNINSKTSNGNVTVKADKGYFQLSFYKNKAFFMDSKGYGQFIKSVERIVRTSDEYSAYIFYITNEIGLDHCMLMPGITSDKAKIEMHHGPILTLYDYCAIVVESMLHNGEPISSFRVAKVVMEEHYNNNVQVLMLSKTAHQLVHTGKIFIHPTQAWGNLDNFIEKYKDGLTREQIETINEYLILSEQNKTTDGGTLKAGTMSDWNKANSELLDLEDEDE